MSWKLSRTVLRGAVGGNADCLLDPKEGKPPKQPYAFQLLSGNLFVFDTIPSNNTSVEPRQTETCLQSFFTLTKHCCIISLEVLLWSLMELSVVTSLNLGNVLA